MQNFIRKSNWWKSWQTKPNRSSKMHLKVPFSAHRFLTFLPRLPAMWFGDENLHALKHLLEFATKRFIKFWFFLKKFKFTIHRGAYELASRYSASEELLLFLGWLHSISNHLIGQQAPQPDKSMVYAYWARSILVCKSPLFEPTMCRIELIFCTETQVTWTRRRRWIPSILGHPHSWTADDL